MFDFDYDDYNFDELLQGTLNYITIGLGLLILPGSLNLIAIHLMRQVYAEKRQQKKKR